MYIDKWIINVAMCCVERFALSASLDRLSTTQVVIITKITSLTTTIQCTNTVHFAMYL